MVGDAVFLGDPLIRRNDRMAVMATLPTADDRACHKRPARRRMRPDAGPVSLGVKGVRRPRDA